MHRSLPFGLACVLLGSSCDALLGKLEDEPAPLPPPVAPVATVEPETEDPTANMSAAAKTWVEKMRKLMPMMCDEAYFKACFALAASECEQLVSTHFEACLRKHPDAVPSSLTPESGVKAGQILSICLITDIEAVVAAAGKGVTSPECERERRMTRIQYQME